MEKQAIYTAIAILHLPDLLPTIIKAPARYPDLWVVLNVLLSFGVFAAGWLWGMGRLVKGVWALGGFKSLGGGGQRHEEAVRRGMR